MIRQNKEFFEKKSHVMDKNHMYYNKDVFIATDYKSPHPITFNNFVGIERIVLKDKIVYKWRIINRKYLILYILNTHYLDFDKKSTQYYVLHNNIKYDVFEDELFRIIMRSRVDYIEVFYVGDENTKQKLYNKERKKMMYLNDNNNANTTFISRYSEKGRTRYEYIFSMENIKKQIKKYFGWK